MTAEIRAIAKTLYMTDFVSWIEATVQQLRHQEYGQVDWENLIEEIEDMSRRERRALESNLIVVMLHLLKWQYQPECRSGSWKASLREHRRRIQKALQDSPSLMGYVNETFEDCYGEGRMQASDETGLALGVFPEHCPYSLDPVLDSSFLPEMTHS
ncbi:MAG: DUF29 domain-containing protein [Synechococcales cyanobacterium RU_4_20]|nr:DUF29 domain-containing protein [Synechococcales cyanobacterium RU_4_20]NJR70960.1 DUF29 domain-containing protein [Synechococcales cyanobacterium CRU_2_2]